MKVENIKKLYFTEEEISALATACKVIKEVANQIQDDFLPGYENSQYILDILDASFELEY